MVTYNTQDLTRTTLQSIGIRLHIKETGDFIIYVCFKIECSVDLFPLDKHNFLNSRLQNLVALRRFADFLEVRVALL